MAQNKPEFKIFGDAARFFYDKFSESAPLRFERYLVASGGREVEAAAKYRWNLDLCESLIPCLHAAELALRNSIHQAMCRTYLPARGSRFPDGHRADDEWWFDAEVRNVPLLKERDWDKVRQAYDSIPKNGKPITPRVVAELSFGFWVELLNSGYDETVVVPTLGSTMRRVQKANPLNRRHGWLRETFGEIRNLRNRVTHHEPVYHLPRLEQTWELAWLLAEEVTPWLSAVLRRSCRFESVYRAKWTSQEAAIRSEVRELFEKYKAPMQSHEH